MAAPLEGKKAARVAASADYLVGTWCYSHYVAGNEKREQRIVYVFAADGSLHYQNSPGTEINRPGSWEIDGDALKILPTHAAFRLTVKSKLPDQFVLTGMGDHVFARGECASATADAAPGKRDLEVIPVYVDENGEGVLRFSAPDGGPFWLAEGGLTGDPSRPFETVAGDLGPFHGPNVAIHFADIRNSHLPPESIAWSLYKKDPFESVAYFRPQTDPAKAESRENCGEVRPSGECSEP